MTNKKTLRVKVVDVWPNFRPENELVLRVLGDLFQVEYVHKDPQLLVYSSFGTRHTQFTDLACVKLFFTGENAAPDFSQCDYALGFDELEFGDRYLRMPLFAKHQEISAIIHRPQISQADVDARKRFCNFIYSNRRAAPLRQEIFTKLNAYKPIESAGKYLRNVMVDSEHSITKGRGKPNSFDKLTLQSQYRFSIAFENSEYRGYTTEKIMDAFAARTIPIYWGNPDVLKDFNPDSFINAYDFDSIDALVEEIKRIDNDPAAYLDMLNAPVFSPAFLAEEPMAEKLAAFLMAIGTPAPEVARKRPKSGWSRDRELSTAWRFMSRPERLKKYLSRPKEPTQPIPGYNQIRK